MYIPIHIHTLNQSVGVLRTVAWKMCVYVCLHTFNCLRVADVHMYMRVYVFMYVYVLLSWWQSKHQFPIFVNSLKYSPTRLLAKLSMTLLSILR